MINNKFLKFLLLAIAVPIFVGCECYEKHFVQQKFSKILNIKYTPKSDKDECHGCFTDEGSWMGFTIPDSTELINGFCGPFSIDNRYWFAKSIINVHFKKDTSETFIKDSTNYLPGEINLFSHSESGRIHQKLAFINKNTALLEVKNEPNLPLLFSASRLNKSLKLSRNKNHVICKHPSGEYLVLSFEHKGDIKIKNNNYQVTISPSENCYVAISFFDNENDLKDSFSKINHILNHPHQVLSQQSEKWEGYLRAVLRKDMPHEYDRIAVKSVVTLLSNWRSKRGGLLHDGVIPSHAVNYFIGFWAWDSWRFSAALAKINPELAKDQIRAMFDYQLSDGMIIDCIYTNPEENNLRNSKPPLAGWAVNKIYEATLDTTFVNEIYPELLSYYKWWYKKRDHDKNGYCEFGSTDGTLVAAAWESGMDNAIRFDHAQMVKNGHDSWSVNQESVDLNCYLAQEYGYLKKFAQIIHEPFNLKDRRKEVADYFFDKEKGFFFDKKLGEKAFITDEGCEAYIPFFTHLASKEQMNKALIKFKNEKKFATYIPFPTVAADHPKFTPKGYWRGPIWLDQTYFAIKGLRNYNHSDYADRCTREVFDRLYGLKNDSPIHENYGTHTGELLQAPHFSWSAAHLLMLYQDYQK